MISKETKNWVYQKFNNKCVKCGSAENLTIDHIVPVIEGGINMKENLQLLCYPCNVNKSSKYKLPFLKHLRKIWFIHDYVQNWKNEIRGQISTIRGNVENNIKAHTDKKSAEIQSLIDTRFNKLMEINKQQSEKIKMLEEYLKIEIIPEQLQKAKYEKVKLLK